MDVVKAFETGGPFMYLILVFCAFALAFLCERGVALYILHRKTPKEFRERINECLERGDLKGALKFAQKVNSGTSRIFAAGLIEKLQGGSEEHLQARMDEQLSREIEIVDRRTGFLSMFGNVATLVGLLGTISGMIHSFAAVATASPMDRATELSRGISEAMNCTAFGLLVAVPALVGFAVFQNKTDRIVTSMTNTTAELFHDLIFLLDARESSVLSRRSQRQKESEEAAVEVRV